MRTVVRFVCSLLVLAVVGPVLSYAQERLMGGVGITVFSDANVTLDRSVPDLAVYNLRNRVSSVRPVGSTDPTPPPTSDWYLVIFDRTNYQGIPTNYNGPVTNINQRVRSVTIGRGRWELCEGPDFTGRCVVLDRSVPNFGVYNLRNRISSLRPLRREPR